jgi:hypothetical protein
MIFTARAIAKYAFMPQIGPRLAELFGSGFSFVAYNMALIYRSLGLLPEYHPYLDSKNTGKFGISHVLAEASGNLKYDIKHIDQLIAFFILLIAIILLGLQLIAIIAGAFMHSAAALPAGFGGYFITNPPTHDIAFVLLERVFGVPGGAGAAGFFNTCVSLGIPCFQTGAAGESAAQVARNLTLQPDVALYPGGTFPSAFHDALRGVMQWYSIGLLVIAVMIFTYFIFAILAETAETGTPFGRRFNKVWAPLRIVAAFGLLIPMTAGLNGAQYITLWVAKWGSSFATNGWKLVITTVDASGSTLLGNPTTLIAYPQLPPQNMFAEFFSSVAACVITSYRTSIDGDHPDVNDPSVQKVAIDAYIVRVPIDGSEDIEDSRIPWSQTTYANALIFSRYQDIVIRFGEIQYDPPVQPQVPLAAGGPHKYGNEKGGVYPTCGELVLPTGQVDNALSTGAYNIQELWYDGMRQLWYDASWNNATNPPTTYYSYNGALNRPFAPCPGNIETLNDPPRTYNPAWQYCDLGLWMANKHLPDTPDPNPNPNPDAWVLNNLLQFTIGGLTQADIIAEAANMANTGLFNEEFADLGWAGAAIWYNKVVQANGAFYDAVYNIPIPKKYPAVMERVKELKLGEDNQFDFRERFSPYISGEETQDKKDVADYDVAKVLYEAQSIWHPLYPEPEANTIKSIISAIFGLEGLYSLRENTAANIHPLAQLAGVGKSIVESSIRNLGYAGMAYVGGGVANIAGQSGVGGPILMAADAITSIGMMGIGIGFVLFYIIPLMPFIYFFFAVSGWIKGIFEAMVGVPLWALAHLRIDGEGLPGDAAMNGYFLLLEIFLRPILIIFGLVAALQIFAAQVFVLHNIWEMVLWNVGGFREADANAVNPLSFQYLKGQVDSFFYTVIYAIIVYMLGMAAFKLIDLIPNHILRWIGSTVPTFGEQAGDPAENLVRNTMLGSRLVGGSVSGGMKSLGAATKNLGG